MMTFLLILTSIYVIGSIFIFISLYSKNKIIVEKNTETEKQNLELEQKWLHLTENINTASSKLKELQDNIKETEQVYSSLKDVFNDFQNNLNDKKIEAIQRTKEEVDSQKEEMASIITTLIEKYNIKRNEMEKELDGKRKRINACIEDLKRQEEKKKNKDFYCLEISQLDLDDISKLLDLSKTLHQPDVLRKLVYKTFFEKRMNELLGRVAGNKSEHPAVYKITHIDSGMCYIGQTTNLKDRWRKHLKCGLGIETPMTNSFYQGMLKYGVWNFTWEVIEFCSKEELNLIEKYWIDFYQTNIWGWNSKGGNSK